MNTSKLVLALLILASSLWQGCYSTRVVDDSREVDILCVYRGRPLHPGLRARVVVCCRLTDDEMGLEPDWIPFEGPEGWIEIKAPANEVRVLKAGMEEMLALHCHSVESIEGSVRFDADAGCDDGAELTLILSTDSGTDHVWSETFTLRGTWHPVEPSDAGCSLILDARPWPSAFRLVRRRVEIRYVSFASSGLGGGLGAAMKISGGFFKVCFSLISVFR